MYAPSPMPTLIIPANYATPPAILTCFSNSIVIFTRPSETKHTLHDDDDDDDDDDDNYRDQHHKKYLSRILFLCINSTKRMARNEHT